MPVREYFSADYREARSKFRDAAIRAGAALESHVNPKVRGPEGEELARPTWRAWARATRAVS